ncbi:MAG: S9 family peptidase [Candidatus Aminicenantes bacterium]|nr:S9 family peptidase [Candidatus Aminicenantes bacterium]
MQRIVTFLIAATLFLTAVTPVQGAGFKQELSPWLVLGPLPVTEAEIRNHETDEALVGFSHLDASRMSPRLGATVEWGTGSQVQWREYRKGNLAVSAPAIYYLATWVDAGRWLAARLLLDRVDYAFTVYLDGKARETTRVHADTWGVDMHLPTGCHQLVVKLLVRPKRIPRFLPHLEWSDEFGTMPLRAAVEPGRKMDIEHVIGATEVVNLQMAPDGRHVAVSLKRLDPGDIRRSWTEIVEVDSGRVAWTSQGVGNVSGVTWLPDSSGFALIRKHKENADILVHRLKDHSLRMVCAGIARLQEVWWSADNRYLIYAVTEPPLPDSDWRYVREIVDRAASPPRHMGLFIHFLSGSVTRCLTRPEERFHAVRISPDGKRILLERKVPDTAHRPYERYEGVLVDPATMERETLLADPWINEASWAPDSSRLLVIGGASAFGGQGNVLQKDTIPNDFDGQAYLFSIAGRSVTAISRDFAPSISTGFWHPHEDCIHFHVVNGANESLATWRKDRGFEIPGFPVEVVHRVDWSRQRPIAVAWASGATTPHRLYRVDLKRHRVGLLRDFNADLFHNTRFGKVEDRDFRTPEGRIVPGRLYYPPLFNPNRRYPLIVYYYGGTTPVSRDFAGRYPKNWYAAQGYMVYVLQPTGTVGYGQAASAVHVNDWGKQTAAEVVAAVEALAESHPNVDADRIGAMGASYGGFLTQYLAAATNRFSALISHAGISSLASYWGVGDWGILYSGVASADSFPWNRKPLYVDQSPLFMADRIHTPLLLLHGEKDNNVPPGESYQMFGALKLLNREVALVTFKDQQHFILDPPQRRRWMRTIIAWFDRWLKNEPQAWNEMYAKQKTEY